jgi:hypothetical protein
MSEQKETSCLAVRFKAVGVVLLTLLVVVAASLLFRFGSGTAFAEDAATSDGADFAVEGDGLTVVNEDGVVRYSTDGGVTWQEGYPDGYSAVTDEQGGLRVSVGEQPLLNVDGLPSASGYDGAISLAEVNEDGILRYSTDGGATWSEEVPEGIDGAINLAATNEDGVFRFSTDGGATWSEGS